MDTVADFSMRRAQLEHDAPRVALVTGGTDGIGRAVAMNSRATRLAKKIFQVTHRLYAMVCCACLLSAIPREVSSARECDHGALRRAVATWRAGQ